MVLREGRGIDPFQIAATASPAAWSEAERKAIEWIGDAPARYDAISWSLSSSGEGLRRREKTSAQSSLLRRGESAATAPESLRRTAGYWSGGVSERRGLASEG